MSTTHRSDGPLLPGYHHSGDRGQGVLASTIPTSGTHGPSLAYPGLNLPAEAGAEVMVSILTVPSTLTFFSIDELGVVQAEGPDGVHVGTYRLWVAGVDAGTSTWRVTFGPVASLSGTAVFDPIVVSGQITGLLPSSGAVSGTAVFDPLLVSGQLTGALPPSGEVSGTVVWQMLVDGTITGFVQPRPPTRERVVVAGRSQVPTKLKPLDVSEVDDVVFDFLRVVNPDESVLSYEMAAEARVGADVAEAPLFATGTVQTLGSIAVQRVQGTRGVVGVTYLLRCVAVLSSGRRLPAQAFLKIVRRA